MSRSTNPEAKLPAHLDPKYWFIGIGTIFFAWVAWMGSGQPGMALKDGYYGCEHQMMLPIPMGATVEGGEVVSVFGSVAAESVRPVQWSNAERTSASTFRVTADNSVYVCSYEGD